MVNLPRTLDEISKASEVNKKKIGKAYRHLAKELDENDNTVGRLMKIFGPVSNPFSLFGIECSPFWSLVNVTVIYYESTVVAH